MKIVIYNAVDVLTKHKHILEQIKDKFWCVDNCYDLERLIKGYPDEDIEGLIMPDAHENPEFADIIRAIYIHKKNLCEEKSRQATTQQQIPPMYHSDFRVIIEKHYGKDVLRSTLKSFSP